MAGKVKALMSRAAMTYFITTGAALVPTAPGMDAVATIPCCISAECCTDVCVNCEQGQTCSCSATCSPSAANCSCSCGGGGGGAGGEGGGFCPPRQVCYKGAKSTPDGSARLDEVLDSLAAQTGVKFLAPSVDPARSVQGLGYQEGSVEDLAHSIAARVAAVPVFSGRSESFELVPENEVQRRSYSTGHPRSETFTSSYRTMPAGGAIRSIAAFAGLDVVIPPGLGGVADGRLGDPMGWPEALQKVLDVTGNKARVLVERNNLIRIVLEPE